MHQLLLITALSATTGLFGGGKHCGKAHHGKRAVVASCYSSMYHASPYTTPQAVSMPSGQSYRMAPAAPGKMAPPAPPAVPPAPPIPTPSSATVAPGAPPMIGNE